MTKHGRMDPKFLIEGSAGSEAAPLPDLPEVAKLSVLEALDYTLAAENRIGRLEQLFLVAEGWRSGRDGPHVSLRPQHDPDRVEGMMVFHYQAEPETRRMILYDIVRDNAGELAEFKSVAGP